MLFAEVPKEGIVLFLNLLRCTTLVIGADFVPWLSEAIVADMTILGFRVILLIITPLVRIDPILPPVSLNFRPGIIVFARIGRLIARISILSERMATIHAPIIPNLLLIFLPNILIGWFIFQQIDRFFITHICKHFLFRLLFCLLSIIYI